ncbi:MAG TPA: hypothetical protein GX401_06175 [Clostridiales bacterium]|nr:hypothetical protein [Clostridiales bacterium]
MKKDLFKRLEIIGVFVVFISGALLHFLYNWNGGVCGVLFGAVNESVWEHIKIFAMPYVAWSIIELAISAPYFKRFVIGKVLGLYTLSVLIAGFYYLYSGIIGRSVLAVDIISVFLWIGIAFYISYNIVVSDKEIRQFFTLSLYMLLLYFAMYFSFTVAPPHIDLFRDPNTGTYGIPNLDFSSLQAFWSSMIGV